MFYHKTSKDRLLTKNLAILGHHRLYDSRNTIDIAHCIEHQHNIRSVARKFTRGMCARPYLWYYALSPAIRLYLPDQTYYPYPPPVETADYALGAPLLLH